VSPYILDVSRVLSLGVQCALARDSDPYLFEGKVNVTDLGLLNCGLFDASY